MKRVPLTKGKFALVDDGDFDCVNQFQWYAQTSKYKDKPPVFYAARRFKSGQLVLLHRWLLGVFTRSVEVDHKNFNTLDCRRRNLRKVTSQQNSFHVRKTRRRCSSRFKGVCYVPQLNKINPWISYIGGTRHCRTPRQYLGYFADEKSAAQAYNRAAKKLFGKFALLNRV